MDRLTMPCLDGTFVECDPIDIADNDYSKTNFAKVLARLGEYENAEEWGLLVRLPYDPLNHDVIYYVDEDESEIYRLTADCIEISKMMISKRFVLTIDGFDFFLEDFGKIVFLTREEAEQALKERESE